jgi:predicted ABC-type sugar transport system permease subunit
MKKGLRRLSFLAVDVIVVAFFVIIEGGITFTVCFVIGAAIVIDLVVLLVPGLRAWFFDRRNTSPK